VFATVRSLSSLLRVALSVSHFWVSLPVAMIAQRGPFFKWKSSRIFRMDWESGIRLCPPPLLLGNRLDCKVLACNRSALLFASPPVEVWPYVLVPVHFSQARFPFPPLCVEKGFSFPSAFETVVCSLPFLPTQEDRSHVGPCSGLPADEEVKRNSGSRLLWSHPSPFVGSYDAQSALAFFRLRTFFASVRPRVIGAELWREL